MSPSELLRETGLRLSTRQFRRYLAAGVIPGVRRGKRGRFVVVGPVTPRRIAKVKQIILKFRCAPGRKKLKYVAPVQLKSSALINVRFSRLNLAAILIDFGWWMDRCEPVDTWSAAQKREVLRELIPAAVVAQRLAADLQQQIPPWDGTKIQLRRLRW